MDNDEWYRHYGLDRDPFVGGDVRGLFYPGGGRQEVVEQLQHLARFGDSVLVVVGAAGSGKSTTLAHFVSQCLPDTRCSVVETALLEGPEQVAGRVLSGFGLPMVAAEKLEHAMGRLALFCERCHEQGTMSWVVFDDAQHLHPDALGLFEPLLARTAGRLRLLFFAEHPWAETLRATLPATITIHLIDLAPLESGESTAYLHYRMKTAGLGAEPPFSVGELEEIHRASGGLPGRINALARELLIDELDVGQRPLAALPLWHLGAVAAVVLLLGGLYLWSLFDADRDAGLPHPGAARDVMTEPLPALLDGDPVGIAGMDDAGSEPAADEGLPTAAAAAAPARQLERESSGADVAPQAAASASAERVTPPTEPAAQLRAAPVVRSLTTDPVPRDEQYLLALDASHYLLQVMASNDLSRIQRFVASHPVQLHRYSKLNNGQRWYALVHGDYPEQASARRAAAEFAARFGGDTPWVRRVEAVQREIRSARAR